jgi:dipeptidyl-peptidase-4
VNRPLQLDDFAPLAAPAASPVQAPAFSSDGQRMAWLQPRDGTDLLDLMLLDLASNTVRLLMAGHPVAERSLADQLARERGRLRHDGVTHARWLPGRNLLYSLQGSHIVFVDADSGAQQRYAHGAHIDSAVPLPSGQALVLASGAQLWALPVMGSEALPLTSDGSPTLLHGQPDPVTQEELFNGAAYAVSPDGRQLMVASFHLDSVAAVPVPGARQAVPETSRYGLPGGDVATFSLARLPVDGGTRQVLMAADPAWPYFLGLSRRNDREEVLLRLSRDQTRLQWWRLRWDDGSTALLLEQSQLPWINAPGRTVYRADGSFLVVHEQRDVGRIGLHDAQGRWVQDIGGDAGHVESLLGGDSDCLGVWFIATGGDARERHVYHASPTTGWVPRQWTDGPGVHGAQLGPQAGLLLLTADQPEQPPGARLMRTDGTLLRRFERPPRPYEAGLVMPVFVDATAADGRTGLHAAAYAPAGPGPHPVLLLVYGGPHGQAVRRSRSLVLDLRAQWLAARGYLVVKIDNRGTNARGMAFERDLHRCLGTVEVDDQVAALKQILQGRTDADIRRIGVLGWSYGGYMALRCLQRRPDLFRCAVAGAPVVDWADYDAAYTERYMSSPKPSPHFASHNADGYRSSAVDIASCQPWRDLLLIHGLNDENVLFRHSATLMEQLALQRLPYELLLLPHERHGVRAAHQRVYLEWRIQDFLDRKLKGAAA